MERKEWRFRDHTINGEERFSLREEWPAGPWDDEPDKVQWPDEATGLPCLAVRNRLGAWCGYVGLPAGHSWREKGYGDIPAEVHGGLTFGPEPCMEDKSGVCHIVEPGESDDVMWIGFDCHHIEDVSPGMIAISRQMDRRLISEGKPPIGPIYDEGDKGGGFYMSYKPLAYVTAEVTSLAAQVENAWTH